MDKGKKITINIAIGEVTVTKDSISSLNLSETVSKSFGNKFYTDYSYSVFLGKRYNMNCYSISKEDYYRLKEFVGAVDN